MIRLLAAGAIALAFLVAPLAAAEDIDKGDSVLTAIDAFIAKQKIDKSNPYWKESLSKPEFEVAFEAGRRYSWELRTNLGKIVIRFRPEVAPRHVLSTIYLTRLGFYDGVIFHRVIPGFMAQGGDPTGTGRGGPGYEYDGEFSPTLKHDRPGLLSMANAGPGTDGSQFFLTFVPTPHLDGKHTIFGDVVAGLRTLEKIEELGTRGGRPQQRIVIEEATVRVN